MKLPIALNYNSTSKTPKLILAADVGGTKAHLALFQYRKDHFHLIRETKFSSKKYNSFKDILEAFKWDAPMPEVISIAFAGPILNGRAQATNLKWYLDIKELAIALNFDSIHLINDLEAHAYGTARLEDNEVQIIHTGNPSLKGNAAIIAPGTGLGEAGLYWDGKQFHPFATEGGHADFGPNDSLDDGLLQSLRQQYGHVSWERLVSGPGICHIYEYLKNQESTAIQPDWFQEQWKTGDKALAISMGAKKGIPICIKTMQLFFKYLAIESANLVLKLKATGGLFISGGIVPKNLDLLDIDDFQKHFYNKGRLHTMLEQVPVYIILNENTALLGAAYYGAHTYPFDYHH